MPQRQMMHSALVLGLLLHLIQRGHSSENEWKCWNSSKYKIFWNGTKVSHEDAQKICETHNANLTSICSEAEEKKLFEWFYDKIRNYTIWIGYECKAPLQQCLDYKNWNGVDGRRCSYTNWKTPQPGRGHNRARLEHKGSNSTWWVSTAHGYLLDGLICRRDAVGPSEITTTVGPPTKSSSLSYSEAETHRSRSNTLTSAKTTDAANITGNPKTGIIGIAVLFTMAVLIFLVALAIWIWIKRKTRPKHGAGDGEGQTTTRHLISTIIRLTSCKGRSWCHNQRIRLQRRQRMQSSDKVVGGKKHPNMIMLQEMKPRKRPHPSTKVPPNRNMSQRQVTSQGPQSLNEKNSTARERQQLMQNRIHHENKVGKAAARVQHPNISRRPGMNGQKHPNAGPAEKRDPLANRVPPHQRVKNPQLAQAILANAPKDSDHKLTLEELKSNFPSILEDDEMVKEFKSIPMDAGYPKTEGGDPKNSQKNRFKDVWPYDHNRVKLNGREMDYINASYIGSLKQKAFIATQGPKAETLCDFWCMLWQERVNAIVMVTNLVEEKKRKCHQYWPETMKVAKYDDILVKCVRTDCSKNSTVRNFVIKKGNETRKLWQFHFHVWPDQRVPEFATSILNFWSKVKGAMRASKSPVVVHCSAGIGRTGTFIALDILLDEMQTYKVMDVHRCVTRLRKQRPFMVQTIEQYKFIYKAMYEWVTIGPTAISCFNFHQLLPALFKPKGKQPPRAVTQFQYIHQTKKETSAQRSPATNPENVKKNRSLKALPAPHKSVKLKTAVQGRNDYINGAFVDGYFWPNAYIATQAPLADTKVDFWRMVLDHCCSVIVCIVPPSQFKPEEIYFPLRKGESITIEPFTLTCKNGMGRHDVIIRHLVLSFAGKERTLQHLSLSQPLTPNTTALTMCKLYQLTRRWLHMFPKTRAVIHCMDGALWTGMFCAALNLFDQINCEKTFDVFELVQNFKLQRYSFISSQVQYNMLFNLVQVYLAGPSAKKRPDREEV